MKLCVYGQDVNSSEVRIRFTFDYNIFISFLFLYETCIMVPNSCDVRSHNICLYIHLRCIGKLHGVQPFSKKEQVK